MKKLKIKYIFGAAFLFLTYTFSQAQQVITLEKCRELAAEYNRQLQQAEYDKNDALTQQKIARTSYLPAFSASINVMYLPKKIGIDMPGQFLQTADSQEDAEAGIFTGESNVWSPGTSMQLDNLSIFSGGLSLEQPIFTGGKIYYSNKKADLGVQIAEYGYLLKQDEVIELADQAFWQVAMLEGQIEMAVKYIDMLDELLSQTTNMYDLGLTPASEKLKVAVQKNQAELELLKVQNGLKMAKMNLNFVMGLDLNENVTIDYEDFDTDRFSLSNGVESAVSNRNELKVLNDKVLMAEYDKKIIRADYLPTAGLSFKYSGSRIKDLAEDFEYTPLLAGQVSIPLFAWGQGKQKQKAAQIAVMKQQEELEEATEQIKLDVMDVQVQIEEAFQTIKIAEKSIAEAEENLEQAKISFNVGLNTTTELLDAQVSWMQANAQLITAKAKFRTLETKWLRVTGRLN